MTYTWKTAPTNWQGLGQDNINTNEEKCIGTALKLKQNLLANFYSILTNDAPPTCQDNEQDDEHNERHNTMNE